MSVSISKECTSSHLSIIGEYTFWKPRKRLWVYTGLPFLSNASRMSTSPSHAIFQFPSLSSPRSVSFIRFISLSPLMKPNTSADRSTSSHPYTLNSTPSLSLCSPLAGAVATASRHCTAHSSHPLVVGQVVCHSEIYRGCERNAVVSSPPTRHQKGSTHIQKRKKITLKKKATR